MESVQIEKNNSLRKHAFVLTQFYDEQGCENLSKDQIKQICMRIHGFSNYTPSIRVVNGFYFICTYEKPVRLRCKNLEMPFGKLIRIKYSKVLSDIEVFEYLNIN